MTEYTSNHGLSVLKYLGIGNLSDEEIKLFKRNWDEVYRQNDKNLIFATDIIYTSLRNNIRKRTGRDLDFMDAVESSNLQLRMNSGECLDDILGFLMN
jgi:hypothetical protein